MRERKVVLVVYGKEAWKLEPSQQLEGPRNLESPRTSYQTMLPSSLPPCFPYSISRNPALSFSLPKIPCFASRVYRCRS
jgi:hypothetical protein